MSTINIILKSILLIPIKKMISFKLILKKAFYVLIASKEGKIL